MNIQFRLQTLLEERKLSIYSFAKKADLNISTISRICKNQTRGITLDMMERIAVALAIDPCELFEVSNLQEDKK